MRFKEINFPYESHSTFLKHDNCYIFSLKVLQSQNFISSNAEHLVNMSLAHLLAKVVIHLALSKAYMQFRVWYGCELY